MPYAKLIAPLMTILGGLYDYLSRVLSDDNDQRRWLDKRFLPLVLIVIGSLFSGIVIYNDHDSSAIAKAEIDSLHIKLDDAKTARDALLSNQEELRLALAPFRTIADLWYPKLDSVSALATLANRVLDIEEHVANVQVEKASLERLKFSPPLVNAIWTTDPNGNQVVLITTKNHVPFKAKWGLTKSDGKVLGAIMMSTVDFFPDSDRMQWFDSEQPDTRDLDGGIVTFFFRYWSLYYSETGRPDSLQGTISRKYRVQDGVPHELR